MNLKFEWLTHPRMIDGINMGRSSRLLFEIPPSDTQILCSKKTNIFILIENMDRIYGISILEIHDKNKEIPNPDPHSPILRKNPVSPRITPEKRDPERKQKPLTQVVSRMILELRFLISI